MHGSRIANSHTPLFGSQHVKLTGETLTATWRVATWPRKKRASSLLL
jgi:hypothetical protein